MIWGSPMAVEIIQGEIFRDHRGRISSLNDFRFDGVNRVYFITHPDPSVIRGWQGHKLEKKWFYCVRGAFRIGLVEIDDWEHPSRDLKPEVIRLSEEESRIVCVPEGFASCIKADLPDSTLMVFSGKTLADAMQVPDCYRFDKDYWFKWSDLP